MAIYFTITPTGNGFAIYAAGKPLQTPGKKLFAVNARALAEAIAGEWQAQQKYSASKMGLTTLAYTAIDRIAGQEDGIVEALMTYVDTDTLSYRANASQPLRDRQEEGWGSALAWAGRRFDAHWHVTQGVMPIEQPLAVHQAMRNYLASLDNMQLAATCLLASGFSSLVLAVMVLERELDAQAAFRLSRLEEEWQAEQWGRDDEADARARRMEQELLQAEQFLKLLDA